MEGNNKNKQDILEIIQEKTNKSILAGKGLVSSSLDQFHKKANKTYRDLFKDIEISKEKTVGLFLLMISICVIVALNINFGVSIIVNLDDFGLFGISYIAIGFTLGVIFSGITVDSIKKRYPPIIYSLVVSNILVLIEWILSFFGGIIDFLQVSIVIINSFSVGVLIILFFTLLHEYTSVMERGRIFSLIIIACALVIIPLIAFAYRREYLFVPIFIPFISARYFWMKRYSEKMMLKSQKRPKRINSGILKFFPLAKNIDYLKNLVIMFSLGMIIGLIIPITEFNEILESKLFESNFLISLILLVIISSIIVFTVGVIFDFWGRRSVNSIFILSIGIINFIKTILDQSGYAFDLQYTALTLGLIIQLFVMVPLTVAELESSYLGRGSASTLIIGIGGLLLGGGLQFIVENVLGISSIIGIVCIISLFFLIHMKEGIAGIELEWPEYLYHMYVIHESGILIYEYSFKEEDLAVSDLISGGIIGLSAMLKEITRGGEDLKSIDHGDKKLMFIYKEGVIFVLSVSYELIVLRNKLQAFADDFYDIFQHKIKTMVGVIKEEWEDTKYLIDKYFIRKYIGNLF